MGVKFIGITGHMGSGKDTFGSMLIEELNALGTPARRFAFADALKRYAEEYFGWDGNKHIDLVVEENPDNLNGRWIGGRKLLQGLGMIMRDKAHPDFWVQQVVKNACAWEGGAFAVITDCRFMNEAEFVDTLFKVCRDGYEGDSHASETTMDTDDFVRLVDYHVLNNGSLEDLRKQAKTIAEGLCASST